MSLPSKQIGVLTTKVKNVLQTFPIFHPGPGEVLIKNVAVASNPKDWKAPGWRESYECIEGNDVAGTIVEVGEGVDEYKGGERVGAFTKLVTMDPKYGAYAQYTVAPATTTFPIPTTTTFEEAATFPLAFMTAAIGLFRDLGLPEPPPGQAPAENNGSGLAVVINGASSSVGSFAVQLAKRAGIFVVGIAGETSSYAEELGADIVIDYRQYQDKEKLSRAIVDALRAQNYQCTTAFDAVSSDGTALTLARAVGEVSSDGSGKVACVMPISDDEKAKIPKSIEAIVTYVGDAHGKEEKFASRFYRQLYEYLLKTKQNPKPIVGNRIKVIPHGLAGVPEGLDLLRNGRVHGEKLVYLIAQTPGVGQD